MQSHVFVMRRSFSGADSGQGAVYAWEGNSKVGAGRMEILDSMSPSLIRIKLDFIKPFEGHNTAEFTLTPGGDATDLRWAMFGAPLSPRGWGFSSVWTA